MRNAIFQDRPPLDSEEAADGGFRKAVLAGLRRKQKAIPAKFLYDAAKGLWAHHDKLGPNVV